MADNIRPLPLGGTSFGLRNQMISVVLSIAGTAIWDLTIGGLDISIFHLRPGIAGYITMIFLAVPMLERHHESPLGLIWLMAASVAMCDLPGMAIRAMDMPVRPVEVGIGAGLTLLVMVPLMFARTWLGGRIDALWPPISLPSKLGLALISWGMIAVFQFSNRVLRARGVPNEERSVMWANVEMHHINWGIVLVVAIAMLWVLFSRGKWSRILGVLLLGVGLGFIWDEWIYYALAKVTDDVYFSGITYASAIAGTVASLIIGILTSPRMGNA